MTGRLRSSRVSTAQAIARSGQSGRAQTTTPPILLRIGESCKVEADQNTANAHTPKTAHATNSFAPSGARGAGAAAGFTPSSIVS